MAGIAHAASVDRAFLYRHRDLLEKIHALEAAPPAAGTADPAVTCASLQADLLAAHKRSVRLTARVRQLKKRLSEALGEQAWHESGLGAPADIDLHPGQGVFPHVSTQNHRISRYQLWNPADVAQTTDGAAVFPQRPLLRNPQLGSCPTYYGQPLGAHMFTRLRVPAREN